MDFSPEQILAVILGSLAVMALILRGGAATLAAIFMLGNVLLLLVLVSVDAGGQEVLRWPLLIFFILVAVQVLLGQVIIYYRHHFDGISRSDEQGPQR
jgi:hypothetical protein